MELRCLDSWCRFRGLGVLLRWEDYSNDEYVLQSLADRRFELRAK
jgi:hypothetical protein